MTALEQYEATIDARVEARVKEVVALRGSPGNQSRTWRAARRLTQAQLASELGVSAWSVSGWEAGLRVPSAKNQEAIKKLTGIDWGNAMTKRGQGDG